MAEPISVAPSDLLIDEENPRLPQPNAGQREALRGIATNQNRKLLILAEDIVKNGMNPCDLPFVMPRGDDLKRYVVLEGNRRIAALKALENPDQLVGAVDAAVLSELRGLSKTYQVSPVELVSCTLVKSREHAQHWIELRHTGENGGAGVVPWASDDSARFRARTGSLELHSQALNFLESRNDLKVEERRKVPATSYKRLLETPAVRERVGIALEDGKMVLLGGAAEVAKALLWIARDLSSGRTKVGDIYTKDQRVTYANNLPSTIVVKTTKTHGTAAKGADGQGKSKQAKHKRAKPREYLIPRDCVLSITSDRVRDIEDELRTLKLADYANAISVLFRVFLELSADAHIDANNLGISADASLGEKLQGVANDLIKRKKLNSQQALPVRRFCQRDSFLAPSMKLVHQYLHNIHIFPAGGDLRSHWSSLQPFVAAIWSP